MKGGTQPGQGVTSWEPRPGTKELIGGPAFQVLEGERGERLEGRAAQGRARILPFSSAQTTAALPSTAAGMGRGLWAQQSCQGPSCQVPQAALPALRMASMQLTALSLFQCPGAPPGQPSFIYWHQL